MIPNRLALWLLKVFIPADQLEPVMGDLLEEFSGRVMTVGLIPARRWIWRQTWKTVGHFLAAQFRAAPLANIAIILIAQPLLNFSRMPGTLVATAILVKYHPYSYVSAYAFWFIYDILIGSILMPMLIGWFLAVVARGREMAVTVTVGFVGIIPFVIQVLIILEHQSRLPVLPWVLVGPMVLPKLLMPIAVLVGGTLRKLSQNRTTRRLPG